MSKTQWLDWLDKGLDVAKVVAGPTPIGAILHVIDGVVESANDGVSDDSVVKTLETMSKSTWNGLTPSKVNRIKSILEEVEEVKF